MLQAVKPLLQDELSGQRLLRNAFGSFATGVTIVTARSHAGTLCGVTANSFSSLSIDPPLVLWSLGRSASSFPVFEQSSHCTIHVLNETQELLARRFATSGIDRFAGLDFEVGPGGVPVIGEVAARFDCRIVNRNWGGDHLIYIAEVDEFIHDPTRRPLLFHSGKMSRLAR
jgi:3-hydroxy-9,10-secoandrosta-1,3,5(10)-triene-9,17-dione monooxygenase reductase component